MNRNLPILIFIVFLAYYSWQKYAAAAPETFQQAYAVNVAILIALTALVPFVLARTAVGISNGPMRFAAAAILPLILSAIGFALFFFLFIKPNFAQAQLWPVLQRSLTPGIAIGLILTVPLVLRRE